MMLKIAWDESPRLSVDRPECGTRSFSRLHSDDLPLRSFKYYKLPQQTLRLTILKLDGSCFDVQVAKMGSVAELKQAVEDVFSTSIKEGEDNISWSHVWSHFCLCFKDQKLINDKARLRNFGIKDGDQLCFFRQLSFSFESEKRRSKHRKGNRMLSSGSDTVEDTVQLAEDDDSHDNNSCGDKDDKDKDKDKNENYHQPEDDERELIKHSEFNLSQFLRGCIPYSRMWLQMRTRIQGKTRPSRFALDV
ncbi:PREDICTED: uncharacterized protein LOC104586122 [Nelumbo nucifera]|uniref:Uncharacterized protein LOC104586122 n=2 Tax=Nelumbo nucifera TaxID=4432 RepID=A0A1U7Z459_NELNU|nr:PREDICTED: uncharacterized protein LOC104586122 [Nelumbo nucifera]DAD27215.1 TPA_asm: hypothetical protein HUJ06_028683 [Nelumbo nucifera]